MVSGQDWRRGASDHETRDLDEFTYLISGNMAIPSLLQKVWDEALRRTQVFLILCGSYVGMMEWEVLSYHAPVYGRWKMKRVGVVRREWPVALLISTSLRDESR